MNNLITVYITNCNYGQYLNKAIESVINQKYKYIYLIIVDDASSDDSKKILKQYINKKSIKIIYNKKRKGLIKSSNIAINAAKGKYILRLDADDYLKSNAINELHSKIRKNSKLKMIFPNFFWINKKEKILSQFFYRKKKVYTLEDHPAHGACSLIELKFLKRIGGYSENFDRQDGFYLWLSILLKNHNIMHYDKPLFFYRKHNRNLSNNKKKILKTKIKIINFFLKKDLLNKTLLKLKFLSKEKLKKLN